MANKKRPIKVSTRIYDSCKGEFMQTTFEGLFHQFGTDLEESDGDFKQQTVAIVEKNDGTVYCVHPNNIKFLDK